MKSNYWEQRIRLSIESDVRDELVRQRSLDRMAPRYCKGCKEIHLMPI